jgi:hypothetical protein
VRELPSGTVTFLFTDVERSMAAKPAPAWRAARDELAEMFDLVPGSEFERGRDRGRTLPLPEALEVVRSSVMPG